MAVSEHDPQSACGRVSLELDVCPCGCVSAIIVSMNHLMGCEYFQVFIYKLVCVPMWVSSSVCLGSCVYELGCVCMCVWVCLYQHGVLGVYHCIFELILGRRTV